MYRSVHRTVPSPGRNAGTEPTVASPIADLPEKISVITDEPVKEHHKLEYSSQQKQPSDNSMSCTLEFDGAPAGKARKGGAGVILRTEDGNVISRLREGLGAVTNDTADYRALILGLRHALKKGFKHIHVLGDSQLVCMQAMNSDAGAQAALAIDLPVGEVHMEPRETC
ncbi:hypothetical protein C4D60_Mb09t15510 [Musa balbisiana]|uniref:RNase H type-1 domain-containing protein n=1 Tax=Musa balbisiana TaxID=52838 RepID=A0A4S8IGL7_MUSBA|nr:hypothetical protein C4D60_Mb09t15510 [Musa balbisiana]